MFGGKPSQPSNAAITPSPAEPNLTSGATEQDPSTVAGGGDGDVQSDRGIVNLPMTLLSNNQFIKIWGRVLTIVTIYVFCRVFLCWTDRI